MKEAVEGPYISCLSLLAQGLEAADVSGAPRECLARNQPFNRNGQCGADVRLMQLTDKAIVELDGQPMLLVPNWLDTIRKATF